MELRGWDKTQKHHSIENGVFSVCEKIDFRFGFAFSRVDAEPIVSGVDPPLQLIFRKYRILIIVRH